MSHIITCLHLYSYSCACTFCQLLMKATGGCQNVQRNQFHCGLVFPSNQSNIMWGCMCSLWAGTNCLNSEETTQLRRKATWEKGPTIEPWTRDLRCSNTEFQPRELRNRSRCHRDRRGSYTIHLRLAGRLPSSIQVPALRLRVLSSRGFSTPVTGTLGAMWDEGAWPIP